MVLEVMQLARVSDAVCIKGNAMAGEAAEVMEQNVQGRRSRRG